MNTHSPELFTYPDGRMDARNAALYLGLAEKTLAMMRSKGIGPQFIKPTGRVFYYQADLDKWLVEGGKAVSTAQSRFNREKSKSIPQSC